MNSEVVKGEVVKFCLAHTAQKFHNFTFHNFTIYKV